MSSFGVAVPARSSLAAVAGAPYTLTSAAVVANNVNLTGGQLIGARVIQCASTLNAAASTTLTLPTVAALISAGGRAGDRFLIEIKNNNATFPVVITTNTGWTLAGAPSLTVPPNGGRAELLLSLTSATAGVGSLNVSPIPASQISTISAARTLTQSEGGAYLVDATGTYAVTLPAPVPGESFSFVVSAVGGVVTITPVGATIDGTLLLAATETQVDGAATVRFTATAVVGDRLKLKAVSATKWHVEGNSSAAAGLA